MKHYFDIEKKQAKLLQHVQAFQGTSKDKRSALEVFRISDGKICSANGFRLTIINNFLKGEGGFLTDGNWKTPKAKISDEITKAESMDVNFPEIENVMPTGEGIRFALSVEQLRETIKHLDNDQAITFEFHAKDQPIELFSKCQDEDVYCIIMPRNDISEVERPSFKSYK